MFITFFLCSMRFYNSTKWFTLVELIVVITIIGILSTIGFVSYSGYLTGARDSSRIAQLNKLTDSLQVYATTKRLPLPDNYSQVTASGTLVAYQWTAGIDVLEALDYTNGGKDPKDKTYFTYYLDKDRTTFQMMALIEVETNLSFFPQTYAADYTERYPKVYGKKLWVITTSGTNIPLQEITPEVSSLDIVATTDTYVAHLSSTETLEGDGTVLRESMSNANCRRIKEVGKWNGSDIYTINPGGNGEISVYCEMENAGGGWTLIGRSESGSSGTIGWGVSAWSVTDDTAHYSLWSRTEDMDFSEIMVGRYSIAKRIDYAVSFDVNDTDLDTTSSSTFATSNCELLIDTWLTTAEKAWNHCNHFQYWGSSNSTNMFFFRHVATATTLWLLNNAFSTVSYGSTYGAWHGEQWMVFVR